MKLHLLVAFLALAAPALAKGPKTKKADVVVDKAPSKAMLRRTIQLGPENEYKQVSAWTSEDIALFFKLTSGVKVAPAVIEEAGVQSADLFDGLLDDAVFAELGVKKALARKKILKAIDDLDTVLSATSNSIWEWRLANLHLHDAWIVPLAAWAPSVLMIWSRFNDVSTDDVLDEYPPWKFWLLLLFCPHWPLLSLALTNWVRSTFVWHNLAGIIMLLTFFVGVFATLRALWKAVAAPFRVPGPDQVEEWWLVDYILPSLQARFKTEGKGLCCALLAYYALYPFLPVNVLLYIQLFAIIPFRTLWLLMLHLFASPYFLVTVKEGISQEGGEMLHVVGPGGIQVPVPVPEGVVAGQQLRVQQMLLIVPQGVEPGMTFTGPALNYGILGFLWTPEGPQVQYPCPVGAEAGMAVTITVATPTAVVVELSSMRNKRNSSKEPMDQSLFNEHSSSGQVREELPSRIEETEALAMAGLVRRSSARLGYREEAE